MSTLSGETQMSSFPHIRVKGSAAQRGRQLGQQAADRIARSVDIYREIFGYYAGWDWPQVVEHAKSYRPAIEAYQPRYLDEIEGMAKGAGLDVGDLLAINVRTEVMFAAVARQAAKECTAIVALPQATAHGHTLIAQNWDWKPHMSETVIVLEAEQDEGPNFVTVVEAGLLAKTGFNSAGIGLTTNALVTDQDRGEPGAPYHIILRGILDAETMSEALAAINRHPRASAANYLIAHRDGEAINVEAAPGDHSRIYIDFPEDEGTFTHTNHYACATFDLKDVTLWDGPDSPFRMRRMQQFLKRAHGKLGPDTLQQFFGDHFNHPDGICTHPDPRVDKLAQYATVVSVVMDLSAQTMWVADGHPCETRYRKLDYSPLLHKAPSLMQ
jgi:isopenicillin-N N-acyltransferase-like protein